MQDKRKGCLAVAAGLLLALLVLCGPAATWLQSRQSWVSPESHVDAVYLVCGARAQDRRITALVDHLAPSSSNVPLSTSHLPPPTSNLPAPTFLIGNDPQKSFWCRKHQTNHTKTEWAVEKLTTTIDNSNLPPYTITIVPGTFANTDGEMAALATYLHAHPKIQSISLVTSRFHARRCLQRFRTHVGMQFTVGHIPGVKYWENRAPWIVLGELMKILRDRLHLSHILTRHTD